MFELPQEQMQNLGNGPSFGGNADLPFPSPVVYVVNGDASLKQAGGVQYYGGWATDAEKVEEMVNAKDILPLPDYFKRHDMYTASGTRLDVFTTRSVCVTPLAMRQSWITRDGQRKLGYTKGARHHVQVVAILGQKFDGDNKFSPWGPITLSAKGFQARNLINAFSAWEKHTSRVRANEANGLPANMFYFWMGTFGQERKAEMVGSTNKSPITPIIPHLPEADVALLTSAFGGEKLSSMLIDLTPQTEEWSLAWQEDSHDELYNRERQADDWEPESQDNGDMPF